MKKMTVFLGADHAGYRLKRLLLPFVRSLGYSVVDKGAKKLEPTDDYPDYAFSVGRAVARGTGRGILVCGSAQGVCIAANKVKGIRAAAVNTVHDAALSREHNDANVLCLAGWGTHLESAKAIVRAFLRTRFSGAARHRRRIKKIAAFEKNSG